MRTKTKPPKPVQVMLTHDDLIREAGFRIHARPAKGPVLWIKDGRTYPHDFALQVATRKQVLSTPDLPPVPDEPAATEAAAEDDRVKF